MQALIYKHCFYFFSTGTKYSIIHKNKTHLSEKRINAAVALITSCLHLIIVSAEIN